MKIQYCSDLHLEFNENESFLRKMPIKALGDILILAGDISYYDKEHFDHPFFDLVSRKFEKVYYIPGNHEFYNGIDARILHKPFCEPIRNNIFLINNETISIGDIDLFFTPLWTKIIPERERDIEFGLNDFRRIYFGERRINIQDYNGLHETCLKYLEQAVSSSTARIRIIATHHIPTQKCNPAKYQGSALSSAFVVDLDERIRDWDIDFWIYGHHHVNMPDIQLYGTQLVTNQLGYAHIGEEGGYRSDAILEVD